MKKQTISFNIILILLICLLAACSSSGQQPDAATETPAQEPANIKADIKIENGIKNDKNCLILKTTIDMDGDGTAENIAVYFVSDSLLTIDGVTPTDIFDFCEIEINGSGGKAFTMTYRYDRLLPSLNFIDFDTRDNAVQLYLEGNGPSADPGTAVFSFDGKQIIKNVSFPGFITSCDGLGKIYSEAIYSVNCYYDLYNGLTPLPKKNIVGTEIKRDFNILLYKKPETEYTAAILSNYYEGQGWESYVNLKDEFICVVPHNTPLTVLDIEFAKSLWEPEKEALYPIPWLKVRTPDGVEGWFCVAYGD